MNRSNRGPSIAARNISPGFLETENMYLTNKNTDLTKKLEEMKMKCRGLEVDRTDLQKENMALIFQVRLLTNKLNTIHDKMKRILPEYSSITNTFTEVITESQPTNFMTKETTKASESSPAINKVQQAVKPMVSGHVIDSPVIVMRRLKCQELDRITANLSRSSQQNVDENDMDSDIVEQDRITTTVVEEEVSEEVAEETTNFTNADPSRLTTIHEVSAPSGEHYVNELHTSSASNALISGIFSAVNVYVTPLQSMPSLSPRIAQQLSTRKRPAVCIQSPQSAMPSTSRGGDEPSTSSPLNSSISPQITKRKRRNAPIIEDSSDDSLSPTAVTQTVDRAEEGVRMEVNVARLSRFPNFINVNPEPSVEDLTSEERKNQTLYMLGLSPKNKFATSTPNIDRVTTRGKSSNGSHTFKSSLIPNDSTASSTFTQTLTNPSPSSSPAKSSSSTKDKRQSAKGKSSDSSNKFNKSDNTNCSAEEQRLSRPTRNKTPRITKGSKNVKMPTCKVMLKRMPSTKRRSRSPQKACISPNSSINRQSKRSSGKKKILQPASPKSSGKKKILQPASPKSPWKKIGKKSEAESPKSPWKNIRKKSEAESPKTPAKKTKAESPNQPGKRPTRRAKPVGSLKEVKLNIKQRREK